MSKRKSNTFFLFGIPALVILLAFATVFAPKPIDWSLSYSKKDSKPYGTKLLFELLPVVMGDKSIRTTHSQLSDYLSTDLPHDNNFIFLNNKVALSEEDQSMVNNLLTNGNTVFIAAQGFDESFQDSLNLNYELDVNPQFQLYDSISYNLANRKLKTGLGYWYSEAISNNYFTSYDTLNTTVLGINNSGKTNFIRIRKGNGWLYLHLNPLAFTNYNLLQKDNYEYAFKCLSYLPEAPTLWDEHYKVGMKVPKTKLSYIFDNTPLRIAYYLLWIAILLFFIFESARRQRMIPIFKAPENSTVNFVETIGRLYFSKKNHLDIAIKKFTYFKEYIRSHYYLSTSQINEDLYQQLAEKSAISVRSIRQLFEMGENLKHMKKLSEADLEQFNRKIEYFYEQCQ